MGRIDIYKWIAMSYVETLLPVDKARYISKLNNIGVDSCPYLLKDWTDNPTQWLYVCVCVRACWLRGYSVPYVQMIPPCRWL